MRARPPIGKAPRLRREIDAPTQEDPDTKRLKRLAFADVEAITELLRFRDRKLPRLLRGACSRRTAALFGQFLEMALQGDSVHPSDPVQLAKASLKMLARGRRGPKVMRILEQMLVGDDLQPKSGHNALRFAHPELVAAHEHQRRTGRFEVAYKAPVKYHAYQERVRESPEFWRDWALLKRCFPITRFRDHKGIIRRSPNPEYNWRRSRLLQLSEANTAFQIVFDFFCWKWFLWGMRRDEPLVEQLFYAITPYGTQIFIPGYWSLDAARDIRWEEIKKLHAARGVARQGEKSTANRRQRIEQLRRLLEADASARLSGIQGAARYLRLKEAVGLVPNADDAQIRRLLREAKKLRLGVKCRR